MQKNLDVNLLLDVYGILLTERQRTTLELYYGEDLSLGEIAEETKVTRQAVMNCIQISEKKLFDYELKLKLVEKFRELSDDVAKLEELIRKANISDSDKNTLSEINKLIEEIKAGI